MQQGTEVKFTASYHSGVRLYADRLRRCSYTIVLQLQFAICNDGADTCANATTSVLLVFVNVIAFISLLP